MYNKKQDSYFINSLINNLPHYIFWKDDALVFRGCNKQFALQFNHSSPREIIGKTDYDFPWSPDLRNKYINDDKQILSSGKAKLNYEEHQKQADGSIKTVLISKIPIYDKSRKIIGVLGIYTDITERKQAQTRIIQLEREKTIIETKRQTISDLAASITHEIGNLLGGIMVNMQLLDSDLRPKIKKLIKQYHGEYQRTLELLNDIEQSMEKARFMFESIKLNIRNGDINKNQFELANIANDIDSVLSACFPGEESVATIKWNKKDSFEYIGIPAYTRNILINLIKNALYFIKEEKKGEITLTLKKGKKFNQLIVRDTAKGISKNILPKIFNSFSTTRKGGMGMGLAFCKRVMKEYGGDIVCDSQLDKYTQFTLTFPTITIE